MGKGFDTAMPLNQATIDAAKAQNYTYAVRYYTTSPSSWKVMKPKEAQIISESGIWLVSVFQDSNNKAECFSKTTGTANALSAYNYAKVQIKQPDNTPIYFAVDYDAPNSDIKGCITAYFEAVKNTLQDKYKVGVYGSGEICRHIKDTLKLADYSWLAMSKGYRGYKEYLDRKTWNMLQKDLIKINGIDCDSGESSPLGGGGWRLGANNPV